MARSSRRDDDLDETELALLRAIAFWRLGTAHAGNRHGLGMAAVDKVHLERGGGTGDWHILKRDMPHAMETLVLRGYLDEEAGVVTDEGRRLLDR